MSSLSQVQVERIDSIELHPNADTLCLLKLSNGFTVVDKVGKFAEGESIAYSPVDMLSPNTSEYDFLGSSRRVKGKKLRGIISCGLALKLIDQTTPIGTDVTELYGFRPYEPIETNFDGNCIKAPPISFAKYDIESLRKYKHLWKEGMPTVVLEKLHGNFSAFIYLAENDTFYCRSRGRWLAHDGSSLWSKVATKYNLEEKCRSIPGLMICGENFGWVADLRYGHKQGEVSYRVFDMYHAPSGDFLGWYDTRDWCEQLDLETVPVLYEGPYQGIDHIDNLAEQKTQAGYDLQQISEGVVIKTDTKAWHEEIGRMILKYPSNSYLTRK